MKLFFHVGFILLLIILYYHYFKIFLRYPAYIIARFLGLTKKYSIEESKSAVGFVLVVFSHILFFILLYFVLGVSYTQLGFHCSVENLVLGIVLGLGLAGTSMLACLLAMKCIALFTGFTEQQVMVALPGGWLKSYEHVKTIFPFFISFPLIILQLACEEFIFRGLLIPYFMPFGGFLSIIFSAQLFTVMQVFLLSTVRGALFPVIGALFIGMIHGYVFLLTGSIWPLIVSHTVFFILFTF